MGIAYNNYKNEKLNDLFKFVWDKQDEFGKDNSEELFKLIENTGNYENDIEDLEKDVEKLEEEVSDLEDENSDLEHEIDELKDRISELEDEGNDISAITDDIKDVYDNIEIIEERMNNLFDIETLNETIEKAAEGGKYIILTKEHLIQLKDIFTDIKTLGNDLYDISIRY